MKNLILLGLVCSSICGAFASPVNIYVAPGGDDHSSGKHPSGTGPDAPMATLPAAIERSRELRRNTPDAFPQIILSGGDYVLDTPLELRPEDSGLVIAARGHQHPVITGETRITGWHQSAVNPNLWQAQLPEFPSGRNGTWQFHELFVNGRRKQRARLPATGYFHAVGGPIKDHPTQLRVKPGDVKPEWAQPGDVEIVLYSAWAQGRSQIRSLSSAGDIVTLAGDLFPNESEKDPRYYIENAPAPTQPGQWRLFGTVNYWPEPGEDMASAIVTAPHIFQLVHITGTDASPVRNITFEGLTFAGTDWPLDGGSDFDPQAAIEVGGAIEARWANSCVWRDCLFTRLGGYALDLGRACRNNTVTGCEMTDLGGGGIRVGEPDLDGANKSPNYGNTVSDNHIHHIGLVNAPAVGILVLLSASNNIAHNEVNDTFYTAISVGWTWGYGATPCRGNIVEFNHLHDIGQGMLSDMGGIYTLGLQPGTILRNNLIHDVTKLEYGGWGLYTDEGSSGIVLESNIVYRCQSAGFHQHYGETNLVYNNIFALNTEAQLQRTRPETHCGFIFTNNVICFDSGTIFTGNWTGPGFTIDHNIYYDARDEGPNAQTESLAKFESWQKEGHDQNSLFTDPMFIASEKGDFRLPPNSPALKFGFHPHDLRTAGPRKKSGR